MTILQYMVVKFYIRLLTYANGLLGFDVWIIEAITDIGAIGVSTNNEVCCFTHIGRW